MVPLAMDSLLFLRMREAKVLPVVLKLIRAHVLFRRE